MHFKYKKIRSNHYKAQRIKLKKAFGVNIDEQIRSPYTFLKSRFYIEISAFIVFLLQFTKITPNSLTILYAILGLVSGLFLASNNNCLILISIIIIFCKGTVDWADGLLARIKKSTSDLGDLLDNWAALVGSYSFVLGFGFYLYNQNQEEHFIILTFFIILIKAIDLKNYYYQLKFYQIVNSKRKIVLNNNNSKKNNRYGVNSFLINVKNFFQNTFDDRARSVDLICFLIIIDTFFYNLVYLNYIFYFVVVKNFILFMGGFYLIYFKKFIEK
ncbi:MAG: CDP-alcohol phosphatidyltransferase family protein [Pelagibacteraceae bacterium]